MPKKLLFPNTAGTGPSAKDHFEVEHPHEGNGWGLFQCSYRNKGEQPKGWARWCSSALCPADRSPGTTWRSEVSSSGTPGYHREHPLLCYWYSKLRMRAPYFWQSLLALFVSPGAWPGPYLRLLPVQWIYSRVHFFATKTFLLGKGFTDTCGSVVISFAKAAKYTNIRNLSISISELHDGDCFKYMYGFN